MQPPRKPTEPLVGSVSAESDCKLICIDPARVAEFWPHVRRMLRRAIERGGLSLVETVRDEVLSGRALLWLVWSDEKIDAAVVTQLTMTDAGKVCILVACGGTEMERWLPLLEELEQYAKAEGCVAFRIFGRRGWARMLPTYKVHAIVLDKRL